MGNFWGAGGRGRGDGVTDLRSRPKAPGVTEGITVSKLPLTLHSGRSPLRLCVSARNPSSPSLRLCVSARTPLLPLCALRETT